MAPRRVFVTVGTTRFDALVEAVLAPAVLDRLGALGYGALTVQYGSGTPLTPLPRTTAAAGGDGVQVTVYDYRPSLHDDFAAADLVISHAGSGSVMEALRMNKTLLVVINEKLMDNHQAELAEELGRLDYLAYCTPSSLLAALETLQPSQLQRFPKPEPSRFAGVIDELMGYRMPAV